MPKELKSGALKSWLKRRPSPLPRVKSVGGCGSGEAEKEQLQRTCKGSRVALRSPGRGAYSTLRGERVPAQAQVPEGPQITATEVFCCCSFLVLWKVFWKCGKWLSKWELWETLKLNWTFQDRLWGLSVHKASPTAPWETRERWGVSRLSGQVSHLPGQVVGQLSMCCLPVPNTSCIAHSVIM